MKKRDKKAALELSIGTIVILVLAMSMLILGLVLVRTIFSSATGAISEIDKGVKEAITKEFANSDKKLVMIPSARKIEIKQRTLGEGFAFSIRNTDIRDKQLTYKVYVDPQFDIQEKCRINAAEAEGWLDIDSGSISLPRGSVMDDPELITFNIPESAPLCTIKYNVDVNEGTDLYAASSLHLTIVPR